ncbi:MAG: inositol monophosphatase family protein [Patescibacteria group bacterium]|nr:inositol monophosphatase family protein [Patescibacteria group bacterium]MDD4304830.1 inositol monophosphatase family protein [Patescibacteria group bacterium]MDD4695808.1 inositol monophosphatase family protein [Patescibacteria group bacterium]
MNNFKQTAIAAAQKSGKILIEKYKKFERADIKMKSAHEIVTANDILSEKIIISEIKKNFKDHAIFSEEAGKNNFKSDYLWIIDPIDGTTNFSMHNPLWSISIALAYKEEVILGIVYAPILGDLFYAEKGKGAYLNNKKIKVSNINSGKVINTFCHGNKENDIKRAIKYFTRQKLANFDCRQLGSAAIETSYVACGRIESIVIPGVNAYDVASGVIIVREAGGCVTDFKAKEWNLKSRDIIASNGKVHNDILKKVKNL